MTSTRHIRRGRNGEEAPQTQWQQERARGPIMPMDHVPGERRYPHGTGFLIAIALAAVIAAIAVIIGAANG